MKAWLMTLSQRERYMVISAAVVVFTFVLYLVVIQPINEKYTSLEKNIRTSENTLQWMKQAAQEIKTLGGLNSIPVHQNGKQFILGAIERAAKNSSLSGVMKRVQPEGKNGARVWFENAPFDQLLVWLNDMESEHGLTVTDINIEKQTGPGLVNARVLLES